MSAILLDSDSNRLNWILFYSVFLDSTDFEPTLFNAALVHCQAGSCGTGLLIGCGGVTVIMVCFSLVTRKGGRVCVNPRAKKIHPLLKKIWYKTHRHTHRHTHTHTHKHVLMQAHTF